MEVIFKFDKPDIKSEHVPEFKENLLSLSKLVIIFDTQFVNDRQWQGAYSIYMTRKDITQSTKLTNELYPLPVSSLKEAMKVVSTNRI